MIVNYSSFRIEGSDAAAFDRWFFRLVEAARCEEGCLVYDYFVDPADRSRRYVMAAWTSEQTLAAHRVHPLHIEMLAEGSARGIRDLRKHSWRRAEGYSYGERDRTESPHAGDPGRDEMEQRVRAQIAATGDDL